LLRRSYHYESTTRQLYTDSLESIHSGFAQGMVDLEKLMRDYIQGKRVDLAREQG